MKIFNNIPALQAYNALNLNNRNISKSAFSLSSGLRINNAADDAAGLAISEKMRAQVRGLDQAGRNSQDGISMLQTAEGALQETTNILQRMRELAVQAANDTLTSQDRQYIQLEVEQLKDEIDRIAKTTQFNRKKLLDGSSDVLWSSSDLSTCAIVRGGIEKETEGNYKITADVLNTGAAEVQKSNIYRTGIILDGNGVYGRKSTTFTLDKDINHTFGGVGAAIPVTTPGVGSAGTWPSQAGGCGHIRTLSVSGGLETGAYTFSFPNRWTSAQPSITSAFGMNKTDISLSANFPANAPNLSTLFEVVDIDTAKGAVTFRAWSKRFDNMGVALPDLIDYITVGTSGIMGGATATNVIIGNETDGYVVNSSTALGFEIPATSFKLEKDPSLFNLGDKFVFNLPSFDATGIPVRVTGPGGVNDVVNFTMSNTIVNADVYDIPFFRLDSATGKLYDGGIDIRFVNLAGQSFPHAPIWTFNVTVPGVDQIVTTRIQEPLAFVYEVGAPDPYKIRDSVRFFQNGISMFNSPQTITLNQGDGKSARITLYGSETFSELAHKINEAIAFGLGQSVHVSDTSVFATLSEGNIGTSEAVRSVELGEGDFPHDLRTLVIRSAIPGKAGEIYFAGDEDFLKAFGLNTIQESRETTFSVSVQDAHSGATIASNVKISGNTAYGVVHRNIDVCFSPLADMNVVWNNAAKKFDFSAKNTSYETILHLADNSTTLQVGANEKEELPLSFGNMSSRAIGVDNILMFDRELAARALTQIDTALTLVSNLRSSLGAYQNRLEHTINNLATASENLTAAESRIRDLDIAKEMMNFTKLNILIQSGQSMLTQANQMPSHALQLLKG